MLTEIEVTTDALRVRMPKGEQFTRVAAALGGTRDGEVWIFERSAEEILRAALRHLAIEREQRPLEDVRIELEKVREEIRWLDLTLAEPGLLDQLARHLRRVASALHTAAQERRNP